MRIVKSPEDRRAEILDGAVALFLARGFDQTTVDDLVASLGISKGLVFYYFHSKEDLITAVTDRLAAEFAEPIVALFRSEGDIGQTLALLLRQWQELALTFRERFRTLAGSHQARLIGHFRYAVFKRIAPHLAALTDRGIAAGAIANPDAAQSVIIIAVGSITSLTLGPETLGFDRRDFLASVARTLELALQMRRGSIAAHL
jgi:AcrR family transcriptional regulator